ncbi:HipA family kinase [Brevibacillus choshinensis]|uniref:HipA-like kinase domain-containing protein n=1 Tax=Brevibacillus choshinensis TaxID=54911 RepID=A0ABX7FW64_BRECH|nr:HipA family kinase [Brevibacillus choshinensis]QRG69666.1 hypothetical protein JNE38_11405 [Brevibacillus choshinensis]
MRWVYKKTMTKETRKQVWEVKDKAGNIGYFKYPNHKFYKHRRMIANEYIAISLAKNLGFPVAKLVPGTAKGPNKRKVRGYISPCVNAREVITWKRASEEVKQQPAMHVNDVKLLTQVIVFDVWILNKDRTSVNLILYRDHPGEKYNWYLIDHGSALLGSHRNTPFDRVRGIKHPQLNKSIRIPSGMKSLVLQDGKAVEEMVKKVKALPVSVIKRAIKSVPKRLLTKTNQRTIRKILRYRRDRIDRIMRDILAQLDQGKPPVL